jgi:hypothetical protein
MKLYNDCVVDSNKKATCRMYYTLIYHIIHPHHVHTSLTAIATTLPLHAYGLGCACLCT